LSRPPPTSTLFPYTTLFRSVHLPSPPSRGHPEPGRVPADPARPGHRGGAGDLDPRPTVDAATGRRSAAPLASPCLPGRPDGRPGDRKSTRLNSSHRTISYAV